MHWSDDERRARLSLRHGLTTPSPSVEAVTDAVVGLHATDPATVYLSARARTTGLAPSDIEAVITDAERCVKHLCMRRTVFVVTTEVLPVVHAATTVRIARDQRRLLVRALQDAGVTADGDRWLVDTGAAVLEALSSGELTGAQLTKAVPALQARLPGLPGQDVGVVTRVLTVLAAEGHVRRGRVVGSWISSQHRWHRSHVPIPHFDEAEATAELVRRYLATFGPATLDDISWWTGLGLTRVRAALTAIEAVAGTTAAGAAYVNAGDEAPVAPVASVALLPALDPAAMGWKQRDWYLGGHAPAVIDRSGNIGATVWSAGRIIGGWASTASGKVAVRFLDEPTRAARSAIERERTRLEAWLDGAVVKPRFPAPLDKELQRT